MPKPPLFLCQRCRNQVADGEDLPDFGDLLDFDPVPRKRNRVDGWHAEIQRAFIAALAVTGSKRRAAAAVGRAAFGVEQLLKAKGSQSFAAACERAMKMFAEKGHRRIALGLEGLAARDSAWRPPEAAPASRPGRRAVMPPLEEPPAEGGPAEDAFKAEVFERILQKYLLKLAGEREARLEGRIAEADFYVRQLAYMEVLLDLASEGVPVDRMIELFRDLAPAGAYVAAVAATPMSLYLQRLRRALWQEKGEPDRMEPAPLGDMTQGYAVGEDDQSWNAERDGDKREWQIRRSEKHRLAAEAQRIWEEKAAEEAARWSAATKAKDA